jgi:hypothetical protein
VIGLFCSSPVLGGQRDCTGLKDDCEFYTCYESNRKCGQFGYPIGFGEKYCLKFEKKTSNFSKHGQEFIHKTRSCLIQNLYEISYELSCRKLKKKSFDDHVKCYVEGGYCELSKADRKELYKAAWPTFWRGRVIKAGIEIKKVCRSLESH